MCIVHYTKISPEFECQGQRSKAKKVTGDKKKRKSAAFCLEVILWDVVLMLLCRWENQHMLW